MNNETIRLVNFYGPLRPFVDYRVIHWGADYVTVAGRGGMIHVPDHMISRHPNDVEVWEDRSWDDEDSDRFRGGKPRQVNSSTQKNYSRVT